MVHMQKPAFVFRRNGRVHLNRRGASLQSTTGNRGVLISGSNAGYTMFRGSVKGTHSIRQFLLHFPSRASACAIQRSLQQWQFLGSGSIEDIELPQPFLTTHILHYVSACLHDIFINKDICCIIYETPFTLKNKRPTWCHLLFYFNSYVLNMFRTLIYPSAGACDYSVELPHWSHCS